MSGLRRVVLLSACALAAVVFLETLRWLRPIAWYPARADQPFAAVDESGTVRLGRWRQVQQADDGITLELLWYDAAGRFLGDDAVDLQNRFGPLANDRMNRDANPWIRAESLETRLALRTLQEVTLSWARLEPSALAMKNLPRPPV